ncbi:hypothetical protein [Rhodocaloribacter sp.]
MDIRNIAASGLQGAKPLQPTSPGEAGKTDAGAPARQTSAAPPSPPRDRIELSDVVRGRLPNSERGREIAFARKALQELPPMSEERLAKIRDRMESGFYSRPEVLHKVAGRLADEVKGEPPQVDDIYPPTVETDEVYPPTVETDTTSPPTVESE